MTSQVIIKNFEQGDYVTLNNGKNKFGSPLGWKAVCFITLTTFAICYFTYFVVPMKDSHLTMNETFDSEYSMLFLALPLSFLGFIFIKIKKKHDDYIKGEKHIFSAKVDSFQHKKEGVYSQLLLIDCPVKLNPKIITTLLETGKNYEFEVAPKSLIVLKMVLSY
jgi:hypothetical protein